ncbi:hypothetical protein D3C85_1033870 [compost metagenome]
MPVMPAREIDGLTVQNSVPSTRKSSVRGSMVSSAVAPVKSLSMSSFFRVPTCTPLYMTGVLPGLRPLTSSMRSSTRRPASADSKPS